MFTQILAWETYGRLLPDRSGPRCSSRRTTVASHRWRSPASFPTDDPGRVKATARRRNSAAYTSASPSHVLISSILTNRVQERDSRPGGLTSGFPYHTCFLALALTPVALRGGGLSCSAQHRRLLQTGSPRRVAALSFPACPPGRGWLASNYRARVGPSILLAQKHPRRPLAGTCSRRFRSRGCRAQRSPVLVLFRSVELTTQPAITA